MVERLAHYSHSKVLAHILQLYSVSIEDESLIMRSLFLVSLISAVLLLDVRSTWSSSGFVYDASAHLSATYFQEVLNKV